jgi:hypothetical protein
MKTQTYVLTIADRFGGSRRAELLSYLNTLVEVTIQNFTAQAKPKSIEVKEIIPESIKKIKVMSSYDKAMDLIRSLDGTGDHHVTEIPDELFNDFWGISEMHPKEIFFDADKNFQAFRVENFHAKKTPMPV